MPVEYSLASYNVPFTDFLRYLLFQKICVIRVHPR